MSTDFSTFPTYNAHFYTLCFVNFLKLESTKMCFGRYKQLQNDSDTIILALLETANQKQYLTTKELLVVKEIIGKIVLFIFDILIVMIGCIFVS